MQDDLGHTNRIGPVGSGALHSVLADAHGKLRGQATSDGKYDVRV